MKTCKFDINFLDHKYILVCQTFLMMCFTDWFTAALEEGEESDGDAKEAAQSSMLDSMSATAAIVVGLT